MTWCQILGSCTRRRLGMHSDTSSPCAHVLAISGPGQFALSAPASPKSASAAAAAVAKLGYDPKVAFQI